MAKLHIEYPLGSWYKEGTNTTEGICRQLALNRNIQEEAVFLNISLKDIPDPFLLKNMDLSVALIKEAIFAKKKIMIVGDYDVDGLTATSILLRFFEQIQVPITYFIPNRFRHGYGLTQKAVLEIIEQSPDLIITVDNGITAKNEIALLQQVNIDVVVTDHHRVVESNCPETLIINPQQEDCLYPDKNMCGAAVSFLLTIALRKNLREDPKWKNKKLPNLRCYLDLVALGTLADQMPLVGVNRIFCKVGLQQMLGEDVAKETDCYYSYLRVLRKKHKITNFTPKTVAFIIAPLLNASGRMAESTHSLEFLMTKTYEEALTKYNVLQQFNKDRRKLQQKILKEINLKTVDSTEKGCFVYDPLFHEGVIGIVAARLVSMHNKPVCIVSDGDDDCYKASLRSKQGDLLLILEKHMSPFLLRFGGHKNAAGCTFKKDKLQEVEQAFYEGCRQYINLDENEIQSKAEIEVNLSMLDYSLYDLIPKLEPFGKGNQLPIFAIRSLALPVSEQLQNRHLKWKLDSGVEMVYWGGVAKKENITNCCDVAFSLQLNYFQGQTIRQIRVEEMFPVTTEKKAL